MAESPVQICQTLYKSITNAVPPVSALQALTSLSQNLTEEGP